MVWDMAAAAAEEPEQEVAAVAAVVPKNVLMTPPEVTAVMVVQVALVQVAELPRQIHRPGVRAEALQTAPKALPEDQAQVPITPEPVAAAETLAQVETDNLPMQAETEVTVAHQAVQTAAAAV